MAQFSTTLLAGVTIGAVFAILAICLNMVYQVSGIANLALAEFAVLGALSTIELTTRGVSLIGAMVIVLAGALLVGMLVHELTVRRVRFLGPVRSPIIVTLGIGLIMRGVSQKSWGEDAYGLTSFSGTEPFRVGFLAIPTQTVWVVGVAFLLTVFLMLFFRSSMGRVFTSCAENPEAASLMAIPVERVSRWAFGIGGMIAALAGVIIAPITFMSYNSGLPLLLNGFIAAAVGGFATAGGGIVGGLVVGLLTAFVAGYVSSGFTEPIVFGALLLVLVVRPTGLVRSTHSAEVRA